MLEINVHENEQYWRRKCLEISDIISSIEDSTLRKTVLKLFSKVNVPSSRQTLRIVIASSLTTMPLNSNQ